ncbi:MAG: alpha/beta fold hydrolase [Candidatus Microthrix sp.]|nr:alpha/beta fold hydrolase [Candidatus Microthrix sp.]
MSNTTTAGPPQPGHPTATITSADGLELALWHLGGEGPPLLLAHATGFAGGLWQPVAAHLTGRASVWAVDFRGHGHSPAKPDDMVWTRVAEDAIAAAEYIVEATGTPVGAAGHSMGGAAALAAAARRPELFTAIWAYEPIIFPPAEELGFPPGADLPDPEDNPLAVGALRRRSTFDSRVVARTNFSTKAPLNVFSAAAMEAYLNWGSPRPTRLGRRRRADHASLCTRGGVPHLRGRVSALLLARGALNRPSGHRGAGAGRDLHPVGLRRPHRRSHPGRRARTAPRPGPLRPHAGARRHRRLNRYRRVAGLTATPQ